MHRITCIVFILRENLRDQSILYLQISKLFKTYIYKSVFPEYIKIINKV